MARASSIARDDKDKLVLLFVLEFCGLTFRQANFSKSNLVVTALFADGAAAALISVQGE